MLPDFTIDGLLPPGDYALTLDELRQSVLVVGSGVAGWDDAWRLQLVESEGNRKIDRWTMIKTDNEYRLTLERIQAQSDRIRQERVACVAEGCTPEEVQRLLDPVECFHAQLSEEANSYEKLKKGDFDELKNFHGIGYILIAMRIYQGLSQRELAEKLGVHESQVSRDERNDYRGITVERANRILEALGAELRTNIVMTTRSATNLSRTESVLVGN